MSSIARVLAKALSRYQLPQGFEVAGAAEWAGAGRDCWRATLPCRVRGQTYRLPVIAKLRDGRLSVTVTDELGTGALGAPGRLDDLEAEIAAEPSPGAAGGKTPGKSAMLERHMAITYRWWRPDGEEVNAEHIPALEDRAEDLIREALAEGRDLGVTSGELTDWVRLTDDDPEEGVAYEGYWEVTTPDHGNQAA